MDIGSFIRTIIVRLFSVFCITKRSKVIFYHDIHSDIKYSDMSTPISLFNRHISIIRECGYEIVTKVTKKNGQIEICFDDAFRGLYDNIEFFKENYIPINLFVVPFFINRKNYMDKKQLLELDKSELVRISSHTFSHKVLSQISEKEVYSELKKSKEYLEKLLGREVDSICFPEGKFDVKTIHIADRLGYKKKYSSIPGFFSNSFSNSVIKRSLVQFAGDKEFRAILKGGDHILAPWYFFKHFKK